MHLLWACLNFDSLSNSTINRIATVVNRGNYYTTYYTTHYTIHYMISLTTPLTTPPTTSPSTKVIDFWNSQKRIELDSSELDLALRFLTQVGIILHFECEIAGLDELYFIDPAWACRTISEIVLSSKVKNHIEEAGFITSEAGFQMLPYYWS